jgi:hypothetical protein
VPEIADRDGGGGTAPIARVRERRVVGVGGQEHVAAVGEGSELHLERPRDPGREVGVVDEEALDGTRVPVGHAGARELLPVVERV